MDVRVADNPGESRFEVFADDAPAGFTLYRLSEGEIALMHTEVDDRFEGQGIGSRLAAGALDVARARRLAVLPFCPFIRGYIQRHPEYVDLVPERDRPQFGLGRATR